MVKLPRSNKQSQTSGDQSFNVQAQEMTVGLSYTEARQVAMDVFEANFYRLQEVAAKTARARAESFLDSYFRNAKAEGYQTLPQASNPDFQTALYSAQKEYARVGDRDLGQILVQLLINRTKESNRNLMQIVLNESLAVVCKLTLEQINILSLVFVLKYAASDLLTNPVSLREHLDIFVLPFLYDLTASHSSYQHLEFASCASITPSFSSVEELLLRQYPGLFCKGFSQVDVVRTIWQSGRSFSELDQRRLEAVLIPCVHNQSLYQVPAVNEAEIERLCSEHQIGQFSDVLKRFQMNRLMSGEEVRRFLCTMRSELSTLFQVWDSSPIGKMTLTSVGLAIAHSNIQRVTGESFDLATWI
jgi:hypothetical protein